MRDQYEISIEFDRSPVVLEFDDVERETRGGRYRVTALMSLSIDGVSWIADPLAVEVQVGKEWEKSSLPADELELIAQHLASEAEEDEMEGELFEELV